MTTVSITTPPPSSLEGVYRGYNMSDGGTCKASHFSAERAQRHRKVWRLTDQQIRSGQIVMPREWAQRELTPRGVGRRSENGWMVEEVFRPLPHTKARRRRPQSARQHHHDDYVRGNELARLRREHHYWAERRFISHIQSCVDYMETGQRLRPREEASRDEERDKGPFVKPRLDGKRYRTGLSMDDRPLSVSPSVRNTRDGSQPVLDGGRWGDSVGSGWDSDEAVEAEMGEVSIALEVDDGDAWMDSWADEALESMTAVRMRNNALAQSRRRLVSGPDQTLDATARTPHRTIRMDMTDTSESQCSVISTDMSSFSRSRSPVKVRSPEPRRDEEDEEDEKDEEREEEGDEEEGSGRFRARDWRGYNFLEERGFGPITVTHDRPTQALEEEAAGCNKQSPPRAVPGATPSPMGVTATPGEDARDERYSASIERLQEQLTALESRDQARAAELDQMRSEYAVMQTRLADMTAKALRKVSEPITTEESGEMREDHGLAQEEAEETTVRLPYMDDAADAGWVSTSPASKEKLGRRSAGDENKQELEDSTLQGRGLLTAMEEESRKQRRERRESSDARNALILQSRKAAADALIAIADAQTKSSMAISAFAAENEGAIEQDEPQAETKPARRPVGVHTFKNAYVVAEQVDQEHFVQSVTHGVSGAVQCRVDDARQQEEAFLASIFEERRQKWRPWDQWMAPVDAHHQHYTTVEGIKTCVSAVVRERCMTRREREEIAANQRRHLLWRQLVEKEEHAQWVREKAERQRAWEAEEKEREELARAQSEREQERQRDRQAAMLHLRTAVNVKLQVASTIRSRVATIRAREEERAKAERSRRRKEKATAAKQTAAKEANRQRQRETLGHCAEAARRVALGLRRTVSGVMEARAHALRKREDEAAKACP